MRELSGALTSCAAALTLSVSGTTWLASACRRVPAGARSGHKVNAWAVADSRASMTRSPRWTPQSSSRVTDLSFRSSPKLVDFDRRATCPAPRRRRPGEQSTRVSGASPAGVAGPYYGKRARDPGDSGSGAGARGKRVRLSDIVRVDRDELVMQQYQIAKVD